MAIGASALMMGYAFPPFSVDQSTTSVWGSDTSSTVTSTQVTALPAGGSGQIDWSWAFVEGNSTIQPTAFNSATTVFRATEMGVGRIDAVFRATGRDRVTGETKSTAAISVRLERGYPPLSGSVSNAHQTDNSSSTINVTAGASASGSGGVPPYTYHNWSASGGFTVSPSGSSCYFGVALAPGKSASGSGSVTIRDYNGQEVTQSFSIYCANTGTAPSPLTMAANPTNVSGSGRDGSAATGGVTFTVSGGVGPFTISVSGGPGSVTSPTGSGRSHSTNFTCTGIPPNDRIYADFSGSVYDAGTNTWASAGVAAVFWNFGGGTQN